MDKHASTDTLHSRFLSRHTPLLLLLGTALPAFAYADIQVDNPAGPTQVVQSPRGVPVINIAAPNDSGLSHNRFERFDVAAPGAIFNNSLNSGVSQLGGRVEANPNLTRTAQAILTEVTGNQPSSLAGALEVFGGKADVIVANVTNTFLNDQSIVEGGDVMINAHTMLNRHASLIHGMDTLNIKVATVQDNTEGSILQVGDHVVVEADLVETGH